MRHLLRYLKPYIPGILAAFVLLFVQANANLALPDYMSQIVNVGIQQGGVSDTVPRVMRAQSFAMLTAFAGEELAATLAGAYERVEPGSDEAEELAATYPLAASQPVYRLTAAEEELPQIAVAFVDLLTALGSSGMSIGAAPGIGAAGAPGSEGTLSQNAPAMPSFSDLDRGLREQAMAAMVKAEYEALGADPAMMQRSFILRTGGVMLAISMLGGLATVLVGLISARIAAGFSRDVRLGVFSHVESFAAAELDGFSTASLITRNTNDIMQIEMLIVMLIRMVFFAPIIGVGGVIRAIGKSASMWWIIAVAVGVLSVLVVVVYFIAVPKFKLMQKLMDRLNLVSREALSGMMVIRAFNRQKHEEARFEKANVELTDTTLFVNRVMVVLMPFMMLVMNGLSLLIIWVGADQVANSAMQVGDMMAFLQYTMQIVMAFLMLSFMFIMVPRAAVSAERVAAVLRKQPSIRDPEKPTALPARSGGSRVEFQGVSFRYPGGEHDALHEISFSAEAGTTVAIIGATGAGKSTIANLIPRFYDVTGGSILVDGVDVREVAQHDLRDRIGYVPQRSNLFSGTIASNLRYADAEASEETIRAAAETAQAAEFVHSREAGLEAPIAAGGANVSGGQKQRLSIARALVKRPPVLIFDDSFSALDFKTDSALRRALRSHTGESTVLIVSQRVASVRNADQILVLDDGELVGCGTHAELLEACETYREIATSQLTMEELS